MSEPVMVLKTRSGKRVWLYPVYIGDTHIPYYYAEQKGRVCGDDDGPIVFKTINEAILTIEGKWR